MHDKLLWMSRPTVLWHCCMDRCAEMVTCVHLSQSPMNAQAPLGRLTKVRARCGIAFSVIIFQTDDPFLLNLQTQQSTVVPHSSCLHWNFRRYLTCAKSLCLNAQPFDSSLDHYEWGFHLQGCEGEHLKVGGPETVLHCVVELHILQDIEHFCSLPPKCH